jgi:hypothetical protein
VRLNNVSSRIMCLDNKATYVWYELTGFNTTKVFKTLMLLIIVPKLFSIMSMYFGGISDNKRLW